jgi:hypothetical protein
MNKSFLVLFFKKEPLPSLQATARQGKRFFFEKKKQKTFATCPCPRPATAGTARTAMNKSFLVLFFKKEPLPSLLATPLIHRPCCLTPGHAS